MNVAVESDAVAKSGLLSAEDIVQRGDEWFQRTSSWDDDPVKVVEGWVPCKHFGVEVRTYHADVRRHEPIAWRLLDDHEPFQDGDEVSFDLDPWRPVSPGRILYGLQVEEHPQRPRYRRQYNQRFTYRPLTYGAVLIDGDESQNSDGSWYMCYQHRRSWIPTSASKVVLQGSKLKFRRPVITEAYRMLQPGEVKQCKDMTDDALFGDDLLAVGATVKVGGHKIIRLVNPLKCTGTEIPITPPEPPFDGRYLKVGEAIQIHDEWQAAPSGAWYPTSAIMVGTRVSVKSRYRRLAPRNTEIPDDLEFDRALDVLPSELELQELDVRADFKPDHRMLRVGEVIAPSDEYLLGSRGWVLTTRSNSYVTTDTYGNYRRKLTDAYVRHAELHILLGAMATQGPNPSGVSAFDKWYDNEFPQAASPSERLLSAHVWDAAIQQALDLVEAPTED